MTDRAEAQTYLSGMAQGAGLFVLAVRGVVLGRSDCCCIRTGFAGAFGREAGQALAHIAGMVRLLDRESSRMIGLADLESDRMTVDEGQLIVLLAAAQLGDDAGVSRQLGGFGIGAPSHDFKERIRAVADLFAGHGLDFEAKPSVLAAA